METLSIEIEVVYLPSTLEYMGKNAFSRNYSDDKKALTIYYNGTYEQWKILEENSMHKVNWDGIDVWEGGLKKGTKVIFSDGSYIEMTSASGLYSASSWSSLKK